MIRQLNGLINLSKNIICQTDTDFVQYFVLKYKKKQGIVTRDQVWLNLFQLPAVDIGSKFYFI